jgi:hypothetical protein
VLLLIAALCTLRIRAEKTTGDVVMPSGGGH